MEEKKVRLPRKWEAVLPIAVLFVIMILNYAKGWGADPHIPCLIAIVVAFFVGKACGYTYREILAGALRSLNRYLEAILILFLIGVLIGSWLASGTIPAIVYYGLRVITPSLFLPAAVLICAVIAGATGSPWITTGTVGIAFMTIGASLGFSAPLVAGMCISGAYTGDRLSPLSDTTNLAVSSADTDMLDHIGAAIATTVPGFCIALILYFIIGLGVGDNYDASVSEQLSNDILAQYNTINLLLLLPVAVLIAACILRAPSPAGILLSSVTALALAFIFQGAGFADLIAFSHYGYGDYIIEELSADEETHALVVKLLNRGGMDSMCWTVSLVLVAVSFGGILENIGAVESLMGGLICRARKPWQAVLLVLLTSLFCDWTMGTRYMAVTIPGQMYQEKFDELDLGRSMLSRSLGDLGALWSPMCPWNSCGAFQFSVLGMSPFQYIPYAFMNIITPLFALAMAMLGRLILYADGSRTTLLSGRVKNGGKDDETEGRRF